MFDCRVKNIKTKIHNGHDLEYFPSNFHVGNIYLNIKSTSVSSLLLPISSKHFLKTFPHQRLRNGNTICWRHEMSYPHVPILNSIGINCAVILPVNNTFQEVLFSYQCYCLWLIWYVLSAIANKYVGHYQLTTAKLSDNVMQILVADAQYFTHDLCVSVTNIYFFKMNCCH